MQKPLFFEYHANTTVKRSTGSWFCIIVFLETDDCNRNYVTYSVFKKQWYLQSFLHVPKFERWRWRYICDTPPPPGPWWGWHIYIYIYIHIYIYIYMLNIFRKTIYIYIFYLRICVYTDHISWLCPYLWSWTFGHALSWWGTSADAIRWSQGSEFGC